jgi:plastocyanin
MRKLYSIGAMALVIAGVVFAAPASARDVTVDIRDDCEPVSFNLNVHPGACVGNGDTTFDEFVAELTATRQAEKWAFKAHGGSVRAGTPIVVQNEGGEQHTFTRVAQFGPGIVPFLNLLVFGVEGPPLPEFLPPSLIDPGQTVSLPTGPGTSLPAGTYRFQCAIHPWMRTTIVVRNGRGDG